MSSAEPRGPQEQIAQLAQRAVRTTVVPGADVLGELSRLDTEVQQGLDALVVDTAGTPYEEAAATVADEVEAAGVLEVGGAALAGQADVSAILRELDVGPSSWTTFLDRVEEILAEEC